MTDNTQTPQDAHDKTAQTPTVDHAAIDESITLRQEVSGLGALLRTQPFWVFVAILAIGVVMTFVSDAFLTERNMFNITRNMAFFGIMALGMSAVICTAGIDLSVGSLMGLCAINLALVLQAGWGVEVGFLACMLTAAVVGFINGVLIAYVRLAPFVVTLGMLAMSRSIAMVISNNKMVYEFGPDQDLFEQIGGGSLLGVPNVVWVLTAMTLFFFGSGAIRNGVAGSSPSVATPTQPSCRASRSSA